ncbi:MAG: Mov34/MPN/PAD-1 family protein [Pseudomonadota bacterium]
MIRLPRTLVNQVLAQAQQHPGEEVCGLIGARGEQPTTLYPVPNRLHDPRRFAMDESAQIDAFRTMRDSGETLFAIYHSHPHAPAYPSATDLAESAYPEALYLIVSLNTKGVLELRAFRLEGKKVEEMDIGLAPE